MNAIARSLGLRFFERRYPRGWEARFSWAEITSSFGLALSLCMFDEHFSLHVHLGWPNMYIKLPFLQRWHRDPDEMMEQWGFSWFCQSMPGDAIHLNWGAKTKIIYMPWAWEWVRTSLLLADGSWAHDTKSRRKEDFPNYPLARTEKKPWGTWYKIKDEHAWRETYPYRYVLRSAEVQERQATVTVSEMEWRWRWFTALPFPRMIRRTIDISFDHEVGEKSGSWKGGVMGCGYELRPQETPREALKRMEWDKKF